MMKNKLIAPLIMLATVSLFSSETINRDKYLLDSNYITGMMYLNGEKGVSTIIKEISNCPYDKCRSSDVSTEQISGTVKISVEKPDYKEAVKYLSLSVDGGNFLAADKLLSFLIKRIDYKSKYPDEFILKMLKDDTNLTYEEYKTLVKKTAEVGTNSKGCASPYYYAEFFEYGYLDFLTSKEFSNEFYLKAYENCPKDSFYSIMAKAKLGK